MNQENNNYIIYKAQNIENGYVYIGTTTKSIDERKKDHIQKSNTGHGHEFQEAISTYGAGSFSWTQLDTVESIDELAQKEKQYILRYDSKENGYNADSGGGFKKTVYQYSLKDGSLIKRFDSLESAGNAVNANKKQISRVCLSVNMFYSGYYWSYEFREPFTPSRDKRKKKVLCYNLMEDSVMEFNSVADASRSTGVFKSCIAKFCRGERKPPEGYKWEYK